MVIRLDGDASNCRVVDCHAHMGYFGAFHIYRPDDQSLLDRMDRLGIDLVCFSHHLSIEADFTAGNLLSEQAFMRTSDRFRFYLAINPNYPERIEQQIAKFHLSTGAIGFKIHPSFHELPMDHPNLLPVYEQANRERGIVLIHVWGVDAVKTLDKLAGSYPDAIFIAGHGGGDFPGMQACTRIIGDHANVYADTALSRPWQGNMEWMVSRAGSDKILFASDMPFYDPGHNLGRILMADLDLAEKKAILGQNMEHLMQLRSAESWI